MFRSVNDRSHMSTLAERAVTRTPRRLPLPFGSVSDTAIAWLFIAPSVLLLLAINIFPLLWTIQLSFTNYRANRPNAVLKYVGLDNYRDILTDPEIWQAMQATAHFVLWSIALELVLGFGLALLINRRFRGHSFWTTIITLPMVMPFLMLAILFRAIENFKMFDMVNLLTSGGPGSTTEVASITLKREAFEKWRTGYSSALAIILFVTVFGAANIYVKALNRVKQR